MVKCGLIMFFIAAVTSMLNRIEPKTWSFEKIYLKNWKVFRIWKVYYQRFSMVFYLLLAQVPVIIDRANHFLN